jgi:hypothetical protein
MTNVLFGKGSSAIRPNNVIAAPPGSCPGGQGDQLLVTFKVSVPKHDTRYLMFFAEMNKDSNADAVKEAKKYNDKHLSNSLLKGLSSGVKSKILNWDL